MKQKGTEYKLIILINILLVAYTSVFMHGIQYALYDLFSMHTFFSVLGWTLYVGSMYLVLIWSEAGMQDRNRSFITALLIGIGAAILKAVIDVLTNQLFSRIVPGSIRSMTIQGIRNGVIGFLVIYFLFHFFSKGKCRLSNDVSKQKSVMIAVIICYILMIIMIEIKVGITFNASSYETENFGFYDFMEWMSLGVDEVRFVNKWFFSAFMIVSWWLMRALYTQEKGEE